MTRIPLLTLVLAAASLTACGAGQSKTGAETESASGAPATSANAAVPSQVLALLPAGDEVPGWAVSRAPRAFTPDTLFELINGAADGFVAYGVQAVVAADYAQAGTGHEAAVEVYQMKDALNAFGKYSEERGPDSQFLQLGNEGYSGGTTVNFWVGQYYVKITAFEESDAVTQGMIALGRAITAKVAAPGAEPRELSWFPRENQIAHSSKYIPKDVLAQSYLTNGFEARYQAGAKESRLLLIGMDSASAAGEALTRYRQSVEKGATGLEETAAPGEGGFAAKDAFYGNLIAVRAGKHIAVALGATSEAAGRKQLADLVRNIE